MSNKLSCFTCKTPKNPFKNFLLLFKLKLRKPLFIKAIKFRKSKPKSKKSTLKSRLTKFLLILRPRTREMDSVTDLRSFTEAHRAPCPSPITPAYIRFTAAATNSKGASERDEVEDACRSFEKYLADMMVEEGKTRDLVDVEDLLYYWKNLRCPVFTEVVSRFYGELCKDLFSSSTENDTIQTPKS